MAKNPLNKGVLTNHSAGIGPVTREMVHARTRELALIAGRTPSHPIQADFEQAVRELTGESDLDRQEAVLDLIPEADRWNPVPGSTGHQTAESPSEDEDEEGRSETEQLVDEGIAEADRDRMLQSAKAAKQAEGPAP